MRGALARMAAVLRGAVALAAVVSAILANSGALSWRWLIPAVILVAGWTAIYLAVAWTTVLRTRAAATLERLRDLTGDAPGPAGQVRLDERLAVVLAWYDRLTVTSAMPPCLVPAEAAEAFTAAAAEALENVVRHSGIAQATVELADVSDTIILTVKDAGRGFDAVRQLTAGFGLREDVAARMAAVGGSATISSAPGTGTTVRLEWRRD